MDIMKKGRGSHFDPDIIDGLLMLGETMYCEHCQADEEYLRNILKQNIDALFDDDPMQGHASGV